MRKYGMGSGMGSCFQDDKLAIQEQWFTPDCEKEITSYLAGKINLASWKPDPTSRELVEEELAVKRIQHQDKWKKSLAEGSRQFVNRVQSKLAGRAIGRKVQEDKTGWQLREPTRGYNGLLGVKYHYRA